MRLGPIMDRALEPPWLDVALAVAREAYGRSGRSRLAMRLRDRIDLRERWDKRLTILTRIWLDPPPEARSLIAWAVERSELAPDARILHVGAMLGTYPFFGDACAAVGRDLALHGEAAISNVRRRLRARWGDRVEIDVAARASVRTLRNLGLVVGRKGARAVTQGDRPAVPSPFVPWIVHALALARGVQEIDAREVRSSPELFMITLPGSWRPQYPCLERYREGGSRVVFRVRSSPPSHAEERPRQEQLFGAWKQGPS